MGMFERLKGSERKEGEEDKGEKKDVAAGIRNGIWGTGMTRGV